MSILMKILKILNQTTLKMMLKKRNLLKKNMIIINLQVYQKRDILNYLMMI